jgi:hypothetical protein
MLLWLLVCGLLSITGGNDEATGVHCRTWRRSDCMAQVRSKGHLCGAWPSTAMSLEKL